MLKWQKKNVVVIVSGGRKQQMLWVNVELLKQPLLIMVAVKIGNNKIMIDEERKEKLKDIIEFVKVIKKDFEKVINRDEKAYEHDFQQFREDLNELLRSMEKFKSDLEKGS